MGKFSQLAERRRFSNWYRDWSLGQEDRNQLDTNVYVNIRTGLTNSLLCRFYCAPVCLSMKSTLQVFANDLNPRSYHYLKENIKLNKVSSLFLLVGSTPFLFSKQPKLDLFIVYSSRETIVRSGSNQVLTSLSLMQTSCIKDLYKILSDPCKWENRRHQ